MNLGKYGSTNVKAEVLCIVGPGATVQVEHQVVLPAVPGGQTFQPEQYDIVIIIDKMATLQAYQRNKG